jgi:hypothetical protein
MGVTVKRLDKGLRHPLGLVILGSSLVLAFVALLGGPGADRAFWLALWGVWAYAAVTGASTMLIWRGGAQPAYPPTLSPQPLTTAEPDLARLTEEALRHLRDPAALAGCELASHLPRSLAHMRSEGEAAPMTPLELAQLLRKHIETSMEKLRLSAAGEPEALQYAILHGEYILGLPNTGIMTRHSVSESTFHRARRAGVRALAAELQARESLFA